MSYSDETIEDALATLPHLVHAAQQRKTITYGELAKKIGKHYRPARLWLEYIRDEICVPRGLPLLTAIVVRKGNELPGNSFLPQGTDHLSPDEYKIEFIRHRDRVFREKGWDELLTDLGLNHIQKEYEDLDEEGRIYNEMLAREGADPESEKRRKLKKYVAENPARVGLYTKGDPIFDFSFESGDICDIVFDLGELGTAVVVVREGERGDLVNGIYQADKCRALMELEEGRGERYPVKSILVSYDIPDDIVAFAEKLDIRPCRIKHAMVESYFR